jgi:hypothetical protein
MTRHHARTLCPSLFGENHLETLRRRPLNTEILSVCRQTSCDATPMFRAALSGTVLFLHDDLQNLSTPALAFLRKWEGSSQQMAIHTGSCVDTLLRDATFAGKKKLEILFDEIDGEPHIAHLGDMCDVDKEVDEDARWVHYDQHLAEAIGTTWDEWVMSMRSCRSEFDRAQSASGGSRLWNVLDSKYGQDRDHQLVAHVQNVSDCVTASIW